MKDPRKCIFILTDACMWEKQKIEGTRIPHAIEVVDEKTGQTRYLKTGTRIRFVSGEISPELSQYTYNSPRPKQNKAAKQKR